MDVKQKILETIKTQELLDKGTHIVLGLSGGPDSVCLFDVLCRLGESEGYHLHPVHVNHKFRPEAAEQDQVYVENLCKERGLECHSFVVDCNALAQKEGLTSEEAGRKARYDAFFAVAREVAKEVTCRGTETEAAPADIQTGRPQIAIAVAQNANDQAETILFRMLRGTGIDGLAGIAYKRFERGVPVVRPLLDVPREEIEKYCEERNLSPQIDHTNNEAIYARNKIRLELLPMLREKFNPNIIETINRLGKNAAADKDYLARQAMAAYEAAVCKPDTPDCRPSAGIPEVRERIEVFAAKLNELHPAVRIRVYNYILADIGMKENITEGQLKAIEKVRISESPSAMCDLAEGFRVYKMYDRIRFCRENVNGNGSARVNQDDNGQTSKFRMHFMTAAEYRQQRTKENDTEAQARGDRQQQTAGIDATKSQGGWSINATQGQGGRSINATQAQAGRLTEPEPGEPRAVGIFALPPGAEDKVCIRKRMDGDVIAIAAAGPDTGNGGPKAGSGHGPEYKDGFGTANGPKTGPQAGTSLSTGFSIGLGTAAGIRHKKLQDFFVDAKVPKHLRDEIDLLAYGNRILWVLPSPHFAREDYRKKGRFSAEFRPAANRLESSKSKPADRLTVTPTIELSQAPVPEPTIELSQAPVPEATIELSQAPVPKPSSRPAPEPTTERLPEPTPEPTTALTQDSAPEAGGRPAGRPEADGSKGSAGRPTGGRNNAPETILVLEIL